MNSRTVKIRSDPPIYKKVLYPIFLLFLNTTSEFPFQKLNKWWSQMAVCLFTCLGLEPTANSTSTIHLKVRVGSSTQIPTIHSPDPSDICEMEKDSLFCWRLLLLHLDLIGRCLLLGTKTTSSSPPGNKYISVCSVCR